MMEREFNNLLALGTDRRLDDVSNKYYPLTKSWWEFEKFGARVIG